MDTGLKDFFGKAILINDRVAVLQRMGHGSVLCEGIVVGYSDKRIRVNYKPKKEVR